MISKPYARLLLLFLALLLFMLLACEDQDAADYGVQAPMPDQTGACKWSTLFCSSDQIMDQIERDTAKHNQ